MATSKDTVYLEDLEVPSSKTTKSTSLTGASASASSGPGKRQLSLQDMFSTGPASKKAKISQTLTKMNSTGSIPSSSARALNGPMKLNSIPFSMAAYQASLTEEERQLLDLECAVLGKSWFKLLKDELRKPYFLALKRFLWQEGVRGINEVPSPLKVYPAPKDIYAWSNTPLGRVKVVIIGQDPYHGKGQAHGLSFSVPKNISVPPSLKNIYAEILAEYPEFKAPKHGNLTVWADNGVLMLNTCLTVRAGVAGSHSDKGWEQFTDKVVDVVDKYGGANIVGADGSPATGIGRGVVFMAWGAWAAKRVVKLNTNKHLILTSAHPSPFSAHRGFLGNGHFKKANTWLINKYGAQGAVDWCCLDAETSSS
ncbi:uracil-DNA glycosylase-like protein [Mycena floridula]|nr:uracil-DNA glycosylase-like protein [Mycena floridula]